MDCGEEGQVPPARRAAPSGGVLGAGKGLEGWPCSPASSDALCFTHSGEEVLLSTSKRKFKYNEMEHAVAMGDLYHFLPQYASPKQAPRFTRAPCPARLLGGWLSAHRCCFTASEGSWSQAGAPAHLPPPQYQGLCIRAHGAFARDSVDSGEM